MGIKGIVKDSLAKIYSLVLSPKVLTDKRYFELWENMGGGVHITPVHFYEPIPDTRTLKDEIWRNKSALIGIDINQGKQFQLLELFASRLRNEYEDIPVDKTAIPHQFFLRNNVFGSVDAEILYCMVRYFKPQRVIEIGAGFSTLLTAQAVELNRKENAQYSCNFISIEPYPSDILKNGVPGLDKLIQLPVQEVPLSEFGKLRGNDILFIDSSHALKIGGDVQYEYLEILPRLSNGVVVHIHDIYMPSDYPKERIMGKHVFWTEQYLLQAFLAFNTSYEVLFAASWMHFNHPDKLADAFRSYDKVGMWPASFWMRRIK